MCNPTCDDLYSPRRECIPYPAKTKTHHLGIEVDSQILNALFCVTGLGLLPWRLRDTYYLLRRNWPRLSQIHAGWYIHGITRQALMYWVIFLFLQNSLWQIVMAVTMWAINRFNRPSWVTGLCISVSFLCAMVAGGIEWWEVRRRKKLQKEGKLPPAEDIVRRNSAREETAEDKV